MASKTHSMVAVLAVMAGLFAAAPRAGADVVYDSNGFEPTRFIAGELSGQDVQGPWLKDTGTSTAIVQSTVTNGGLQAVQFTRAPLASGDTRYGVVKPLTPTPPLQTLRISWDMNVLQTQAPNVQFGPFFGVEGYDAFNDNPKLIGSLGVDATTGEVLIQAQGSGEFIAPGPVVPFGQFNRFMLEIDYATDTYRAFVNGAQVGDAEGFVDPGIVGFTDAPISALAAEGGAGLLAPGVAYFDNYRIEIVPEPTSAAILGLASVGLLRRRRAAN